MVNNKLKYIYWFAFYNFDSPSVRYRAKYPLEYFKNHFQVNYTLIYPSYQFSRILKFLATYFSVLLFPKKNSLIVIQRVQSDFIYSWLLKLLVFFRKSKTVYDLDDADYLENRPNSIYYFLKNCAVVSAGSIEIADYSKKINPNIFLTTSPTPDLKIVKKNKNELFTIGWIGDFGGGHKEGLINQVFPALKKLSFNFKLIFLGIRTQSDTHFIERYFENNKNILLEIPQKIDWCNETSIQNKIISFDIGIATLVDTEIQRSKSGIKAKQYLNNGIPVLSSNLPENNTVVEHGKNGYFCENAAEFEQRMIDFYKMDDKEYSLFSKNARTSIQNFNHEKYFSDLENIYSQLIEKKLEVGAV